VEKEVRRKSVFSLDGPLEVAAMLATSIAKIDGEISSEEKQALLTKTEREAF